jgi:Na+:H+ antiporter, NhaA family
VTEHSGDRSGIWQAVPVASRFTIEHLILLPIGALIALVWANTEPESYYQFTYAISFVVNDVAMVFFFALITKEVVESTAPGGVLHPWRRTMLPVIAAVGATAVPALLHIELVGLLDEPMLGVAWPVALATDLGLCYLVARIVFRRHHPLVPFLLLLGVASDAIGFFSVALASPDTDVRLVGGAGILAVAIAIAAALRRYKVKSFWPYLIFAGGLSWYAFYWSRLHPTLALVPIVPFLPHAARDPGFFVDAPEGAKDTLSRFEIWWRYPAQVALFFFGLVNAGVSLRALEPGMWGLPIAVLFGKPIGVLIGAGVAIFVGFHLPHRVGWRELLVGGLVAAVGFSVGLFFCTALVAAGQMRSELSMGVLLSLAGAPLALVAAKLLRVGRFARS